MLIIFPLIFSFFFQMASAAVNLDSGFVRLNFVDIELRGGSDPLVLSRTYNSNESAVSPFGKGMAVKLASYLNIKGDQISFHDYGLQAEIPFTKKAKNAWQSPSGARLLRLSDRWELTDKETKYNFNLEGKLNSLHLGSTHIVIERKNGKLHSLRDSAGQLLLKLETNEQNLVTKITNKAGESCEYFYDSEKRLKKFNSTKKETLFYNYGPYGLTEFGKGGNPLIKISYNKNSRVTSYEEVGKRLTTIKENLWVENKIEKQTFELKIKEGKQVRILVRENYFKRDNGKKLFQKMVEIESPGPLATRKEVLYSEHGLPVRVVQNEIVQEVKYDDQKRVLSLSHSQLGTRSYKYASDGKLTGVEESGQKYDLIYESGLLVSVKGPSESMDIKYQAGDIRALSYRKDSDHFRITYDLKGRMDKLYTGNTLSLKIHYDLKDQIQKVESTSSASMDKLMQIRNRFEHLFVTLPNSAQAPQW